MCKLGLLFSQQTATVKCAIASAVAVDAFNALESSHASIDERIYLANSENAKKHILMKLNRLFARFSCVSLQFFALHFNRTAIVINFQYLIGGERKKYVYVPIVEARLVKIKH